ncbi:MAG: right-handed parallel beta-helix repeat-containing protein [Prolixibacteraceae bacterium]
MTEKTVFFLILAGCAACSLFQDEPANTFYIDAENGNDLNSGQIATKAWQTLDKVNSTDFAPGSKIFFKRGQTWLGSIRFDQNDSGSASDPLEISAYGNPLFANPEIRSGNEYGFLLEGSARVKVNRLSLKGAGRKQGNTTSGLIVRNCRNIILDSLEVSGYQKDGVEILNSEKVRVIRVDASNNGSTGIRTGRDENSNSPGYPVKNIYIGYCTTNDNAGNPEILENHSGSGIIVSSTDSAVVEYCSAANNGWDMPRQGNGPVGIWAHDANRITIRYCIAYNNESSRGASDGGGFDLDGGVTNSIVQYNYSYDNNGAGYGLFQYAGTSVWENNLIRFNISYNDGEGNEKAGIYIWTAEPGKDLLRNCKIYNNIIINELGSAVKYATDGSGQASDPNGFEFSNNIFISKEEPVEGTGTHSAYSNNLWWRLDNKPVSKRLDPKGIYGKEPGMVMPQPHNYRLTDPAQLKNLELFKLFENSACKGTGKNINSSREVLLVLPSGVSRGPAGNRDDGGDVNFWGKPLNEPANIGIE